MTSDGGSGDLVGTDDVVGGPSVFDLVASALRADLSDIDAFVESLATSLEEALPGMVTVSRSKRGFRGPKHVDGISVQAGPDRLELHRTAGGVDAQLARISGGIVLKRESMKLDAWLDHLSRVLADQAERSERTRQALERLLLNQ